MGHPGWETSTHCGERLASAPLAVWDSRKVGMHCFQVNLPDLNIVSITPSPKEQSESQGSGKKKAHVHKHELFGPVALGTTPGLSQGQTEVSLYFAQWKCSLFLGQLGHPGVERQQKHFLFGGRYD